MLPTGTAATLLATTLLCACAHRSPAPGAEAPSGAAARASPVSRAEREVNGASRFHFVDVARAAGLTRVLLAGRPGKDHLLESAGSGAAFLDYDRDGRLDIYLANGWRIDGSTIAERGRHALYRGRPGGTFEDVTDAAGVSGEGRWGTGVAAADFDGDGWIDLFVTAFGPNLLYRNLGDGRFENVAARTGLETPGWNTGAAFFDADGDGDLDVYIAAYIDCTLEEVLAARPALDWKGLEKVAFGPFGLPGATDHFFLNDGGRRFVDATAAAGMADIARGFGFAARAADYDDDGDPDLYVANDSDPNYLYRNEGGGRFRETGVWSGCALDGHGAAQASMGVAAGDATGDGTLDLVVTNFSEDFTTFYTGVGGGLFEDQSETVGVGPPTYRPLSWGTALADLDNDSDLDLVVVNGHIYPQIDRHPEVLGTFSQRSLLLGNRLADPGRAPEERLFRDASDDAGPGFAASRPGRGLAVGDYDNDGDLDLLITNLDGPPSLLRNDGATGSWLTVICDDPGGPSPPIGTSVAVVAEGRRQRRDIAAGDSYLSTHDPRLHFGLGSAVRAEKVDVRWPDGTHTILRDVPARRFLRVRKGD